MMPLVATALLCLYLPVPPIMLWIHGPIHLWRRLGRWSYAIHTPVYLALVAAVVAGHRVWSWAAWEFPPPIRIVGGCLLAGGFALLGATYREITAWTAMAGPQVAGGRRPLLTSGVYGVIRHPRYAVLVVGAAGNFLLTGYPLLLAALALTLAGAVLVARLEDAELESHFGNSFRAYRDRVPAWLPRP